MYMNQIYFGEGAWGIKRAAKSYFDKEGKRLNDFRSCNDCRIN